MTTQKQQIFRKVAKQLVESGANSSNFQLKLKQFFKKDQTLLSLMKKQQNLQLLANLISDQINNLEIKRETDIVKEVAFNFVDNMRSLNGQKLSKKEFLQKQSQNVKKIIKKNDDLFEKYVRAKEKSSDNVSMAAKKTPLKKEAYEDLQKNSKDYFDLHYDILPIKIKKLVDQYDEMTDQEYISKRGQFSNIYEKLSQTQKQIYSNFEYMNTLLEDIIDGNGTVQDLITYNTLLEDIANQQQQLKQKVKKEQKNPQASVKKEQKKPQASVKKEQKKPQASVKKEQKKPQASVKKEQKKPQASVKKEQKKPQASVKKEQKKRNIVDLTQD